MRLQRPSAGDQAGSVEVRLEDEVEMEILADTATARLLIWMHLARWGLDTSITTIDVIA